MSVSVMQQKQFIGGAFVESSSGETMEVLNPATGEAIAEVPRSGAEDVERAVEVAKHAWADWRGKTPKDRMELLLALADDPELVHLGSPFSGRRTRPRRRKRKGPQTCAWGPSDRTRENFVASSRERGDQIGSITYG